MAAESSRLNEMEELRRNDQMRRFQRWPGQRTSGRLAPMTEVAEPHSPMTTVIWTPTSSTFRLTRSLDSRARADQLVCEYRRWLHPFGPPRLRGLAGGVEGPGVVGGDPV